MASAATTTRILPRAAIRKELKLQFVLGYTHLDFTLSLDLLASAAFDPAHLITHRVGFEALPAIFEALRRPNPHGKVLLEPRQAGLTTSMETNECRQSVS